MTQRFTLAFQGQLGLVDAAYSGDWSRIGVITPGITLLIPASSNIN